MSEKSVEAIEQIANPWSDDGRPPVYQLIVEARDARGSARESLHIEPPHRLAEFTFGPGSADSLIGLPDSSTQQATARPIVDTILNVVQRPSRAATRRCYAALCGQETISNVDTVLSMLRSELGDHAQAVAALARRLIREAPDLRPVKAGVALLGEFGAPEDSDLVATAGLYEEIALYSVMALLKLLRKAAVPAIWKLAKAVHGWGRIHAVNYLADLTIAPEIKDWMLREGFRNRVLNEYLAYSCATAGELKQALAGPTIDPALFAASADLLSLLILGGPAEDIEDYADGPAVCLSFLRHMRIHPLHTLRAVECVLDIRSLVDGYRWAQLRARHGWTAKVRLQVRSQVTEALQQMGARSLVEDGLRSGSPSDFHLAAILASHFGIDAWPLRLERQRHGPAAEWYFLMRTDRRDRIEQVLDLARAQFDLDVIGSGPTMSMGLGREFEDDTALGMVIQDLNRFPGAGWDLLRVGLRNRVCGIRNVTVRVLGEWQREAWPSDVMDELRGAAAREPDEGIRQWIEELLHGTPRASDTL